jgi:hypothetical protein
MMSEEELYLANMCELDEMINGENSELTITKQSSANPQVNNISKRVKGITQTLSELKDDEGLKIALLNGVMTSHGDTKMAQ